MYIEMTETITEARIAVIGAGAMGGAFAAGLVSAGIDPSHISVANPHMERLEPLKALGMFVTTDNAAVVTGADLVVIAVKPWIVKSVVEEIRDSIDYDTQEVTCIVAGIPGEELMQWWRRGDDERLPALSISMPNTAMSVGKSMTFNVALQGDAPLAMQSLAMMGRVMQIPERLLPAATALASCGIAYALRYVRAATEGGVQMGFRASEAQEIVAATIEGAAALLSRPDAHAEAEIDKVTTPGGVTIRGLNAMEREGFTNAVIAGLLASWSGGL